MGLKEGLLCLLSEGDAHGYQLKSELETATGDIWQVNIGQVYTTLQRLERDGLVASSTADDAGRVAYAITEEGLSEAAAWMMTPVDLAAAGRDEISLKVILAILSGVEDPRRVIERQRGSTMALLQDYTTLKGEDTKDDLAWLLYLDRLILSAEAELRWLERVEARLDTMPPEASRHREIEPVSEPMEVTP